MRWNGCWMIPKRTSAEGSLVESLGHHRYWHYWKCSTTGIQQLETLDTVIRVIFLDFTKAFDLIDHNILLSDLKSTACLVTLASVVSVSTSTKS